MATITELVATADTGATPNATGAFTPTAGDLLVVAVVASASVSDADDVPTASANGITFVRAVHGLYSASANSVDLYVANQLVPAGPASMTVSWAPTDAATGTVIVVFGASGITRSGTEAIKQVANTDNGSAAGTPAATFPAACLTGNPTIGVVGNSTNPAGVTEPTDWTETEDTGYGAPTTGAETVTRNSGFTGTTITWGSTSASVFGVAAVELDTSAIPGPQITVFESARNTTSPKTVVVTGCVTGDVLYVMAGGDAFGAANAVTDATASTTAGSTGSWTELAESLSSANEDWCGAYKATVTGDGDVTVQVSRTQSGTQGTWHFWVAKVANGTSGGEETSTKFTADATEVISVAVAADSAVLFASYDWDAATPGTFTPSGATEVERSADANYAEASAYWLAQTSGTRDYGTTGSSGAAIKAIAVEILAAGGGTNAPAGNATATGTAETPTRTVSTGSQASSGTGTANNPSSSVRGSPGAAAGTGSALDPSPSIRASAETSAATGVANNATVSTGGAATNAPAELASATGTADNTTTTIASGIESASATGAANDPTTKISPTPATAAATGTADNPTVQTGSFTNAQAEVATGIGTANDPTRTVSSGIQSATATGTANNAVAGASVTVQAGVATATGTANDATVTVIKFANAENAAGVGTVNAVSLSVRATAEAATALGQAFNVSTTSRDIVITGTLANPRWTGALTNGATAAQPATRWTAVLEED